MISQQDQNADWVSKNIELEGIQLNLKVMRDDVFYLDSAVNLLREHLDSCDKAFANLPSSKKVLLASLSVIMEHQKRVKEAVAGLKNRLDVSVRNNVEE